MLKLKRVYDPPEPDDGQRLLLDRLWPRGLSKDKAHVDRWLKDIAVSDELRRWFGHDPQRWPEFQRRYRQELLAHQDVLRELAEQASRGTITILYAARDDQHNNALVLRQALEEIGASLVRR